MSMPFSRPGAFDLSALKRPAASPSGEAGGSPSDAAGGSFSVLLNEQNFAETMDKSLSAPVVLIVYSPSQLPQSATMAADLGAIADEMQGRFLVAKLDADATPQLAQALQIPSVPLVAVAVQGRLAPLLQDVVDRDQLREIMSQVLDQMVAQGVTGRHQPAGGAAPEPRDAADDEPETPPRLVPAEEALVTGDMATAIAEYEKLLADNPGDVDAAIGLARAQLVQRTTGLDLNQVRAAAAESPDDVDAQFKVADLDLIGGHVDDAFNRLIDLVRRTSGDDRDRVRVRLIDLFVVVGDDPRVIKARQNLASALY
jgi:putative thioredoxin